MIRLAEPREMKTDIVFESKGHVTLTTRNRGRGSHRLLAHLQDKKHKRAI